jgi:3-ketosteroid 9alpha-monooxygenase subunit B
MPELRIVEVIEETPEARSLVLDVPPGWTYLPGQFLTVRVGTAARCYSMSSSPHIDERPKITIKRVQDGYASNWICDHVTADMMLDTLLPAGTFTPKSLDGDFLLFAGGSGITPIISILRSALAVGNGQIVLVYANRDEESVIFRDELIRLSSNRLRVVHWLDCLQGPPTAEGLQNLIWPYTKYEAFVCGPDPYMNVVRKALESLGVHRLHVERFLSLSENPFAEARGAEAALDNPLSKTQATNISSNNPRPETQTPDASPTASVEVTLDGQTLTLPWPSRHRLLDVLVDAGLNPPYSCREGVCGACACRVVAGKVTLLRNEVLEAEDFAEGYILACQAVPVTDTVRITYS